MSGAAPDCGCCVGMQPLSAESNPPGQPALAYRLATYPVFLQRMLAQLASPNTLQNPPDGAWAIAALTTRSDDDPTIALLDAWSVVLDVLTFYQERIANEGYLRTATEHRSVLELARAIGYELNPGVAAGTFLSFIVEDVIGAPSVAPRPTGPKTPSAPTQGSVSYNAGVVTLPPGTQVVSVPPQGQVSQTFETAAELDARAAWNLMLPRLTRPGDYALGGDGNLYLLGTRGGFPAGAPTVQLPVANLYPLVADPAAIGAGPQVTAVQAQQIFVAGTQTGIAVGDLLLFSGVNATSQTTTLTLEVRNVVVDLIRGLTRLDFADQPTAATFAPASFPGVTVPSTPVPFTAANVATYVLDSTIADADLQALIGVSNWDPGQLTSLVNQPPAPGVATQGVFAFAQEAAFFGANAQPWKSLPDPGKAQRGDAYPNDWDTANNNQGTLIWTNSQGAFYRDASLYLERAFAGILSNSWMLLEQPGATPMPLVVTSAADKSLADYSLTGKSTGLVVQTAARQTVSSPGSPALGIYFGILYLYAANSDGKIWEIDGIPGNWNGFNPAISGAFSQNPALIGGGYNSFDLFMVGENGALYHATGTGELLWGASQPVAPAPLAGLTGTPSVLVGAPNDFDVFAIGKDGVLYHYWQLHGQWNGPEPHALPKGSTGQPLVNSPWAVGHGPSETEIFMLGADGAIYHVGWNLSGGWWNNGVPIKLTNTGSNPVVTTPPAFTGSPAVGLGGKYGNGGGLNYIDLFAIGTDGNLWHAWYQPDSTNVSQWNVMENLGGGNYVGSPSLLTMGPSNLEVFMIGADGILYHKNWIGGSWYGPSPLGGGNLVGSPYAVAPDRQHMHVVATGSDGSFYHFYYDGKNWHSPDTITAGFVPQYFTRHCKAHILSQQQAFSELPVTDDIAAGSTTLMLNGLVLGLTVGQSVAITGTQPGASNLVLTEVAQIAAVTHIGGFTELQFAGAGLVNSYTRVSMTLNANTVEATNGATIAVPEVLGSGDASQINQSFTAKRSPITYTPAATASGAASSLQVTVNNLIWKEAPSLFGLAPTDRNYITRRNDDGTTNILFGDGVTGGLLPTGNNNIAATYRVGLGSAGNLPAGSLSVLQSRPPGLRAVTNPVPASGGADPEALGSARGNAPRTVLTIDRIVSIADYANFAAGFAGIGKAQAAPLLLGQSVVIQLTVAGVGGAPVLSGSPLLLSLASAIDAARDLAPQVLISTYQPILFTLAATIIIDTSDYVQASVHAQVQSTIVAAFAFAQRGFGQPVTAAEIIAAMQAVPGVVAVKLTKLYRNDDPGGPTQTAPKIYLPAAYAQVSNGVVAAAELLLLNPVGFTLTDQAQS